VILKDPRSLVDIHSHLVPGVDDGARHLAGVVNSIDRMTRSGIRRIVTTPHLQGSLTLTPDRLEERLSRITEAWMDAEAAIKSHFPEVEYRRGQEVLLDIPEPDLSDLRVRMAGTSFVLIEWPRLHVPPGTTRVLRWIRDQGYRPIVAHPERYANMVNAPDLAAAWCDAGALLQVNYGSLVGRYGAEARTVAYRILEAGHAHYLASDFHGQSTLKVYKTEAWAELEGRGASETLDYMCRTNPSRMLEDLEPLPVPPVAPSRKLMARLRGMMRRNWGTFDRRVR
jgi:protein-tyrosine phosphatase